MLFAVIRSGNADEVRALLAGDSELGNARTPEGATPALWAIYTGHADLVPLLLGSRAPDIFEACALGRTERIGELLSSDSALINSHSADGFTALGFACFFKHLDAAKLLLAHGADASPGEGGGSTPLHTVAGHGNRQIIARLLAAGADASAKANDGKTPANIAVQYGHPEVVGQLVPKSNLESIS